MSIFEKVFNRVLKEDVTSSTAFSNTETGIYGNQFPSQNDRAYNPGNSMPVAPGDLVLGKKKKKTKKSKTPIQRRTFPGL